MTDADTAAGLRRAAKACARARHRSTEAEAARDTAIRAAAASMRTSTIARLVGLSPQRVHQIVTRHQEATPAP